MAKAVKKAAPKNATKPVMAKATKPGVKVAAKNLAFLKAPKKK